MAHSTCLLNEACILKDVDASTGNNQESEQQERKQQVKHGQHLDQQGRVQDAKIAGSGKEEKIEEVLRMEMDDDTESEDEDMQQISAAGQAAPSAVQLEGFIEEEGGEEEEDVAGSALINTAAGVQQVEQMINTLSDILEQAQVSACLHSLTQPTCSRLPFHVWILMLHVWLLLCAIVRDRDVLRRAAGAEGQQERAAAHTLEVHFFGPE